MAAATHRLIVRHRFERSVSVLAIIRQSTEKRLIFDCIRTSGDTQKWHFGQKSCVLPGRSLVEKWEDFLLREMELGHLSTYLEVAREERTNALPFLRKLDENLSQENVKFDSVVGVSSILYEMTNSSRIFSESAYRALFASILASDCPPNALSAIVASIPRTFLPVSIQISYLTAMVPQVTAKMSTMDTKSRAKIIEAYAKVPMEHTAALLEAGIAGIDYREMTTEEVAKILNALCMFPMQGDASLFATMEGVILGATSIAAPELSLIVHAYAKRNMGSKALFSLFESLFEMHKPTLSHRQTAFLTYSLLRSPKSRLSFKERLVEEVPALLRRSDVSEKVKEALRFWSRTATQSSSARS